MFENIFIYCAFILRKKSFEWWVLCADMDLGES
jgi:hypothetical protein